MSSAPVSADPAVRPTQVRYRVLGLLCLLAMITYMDRAMYGSARADLMAAVGRPATDFFYVLVAFQLAYALFEIPAGWLGDTFGPRAALLRVVVWWSAFVGLTGLAGYPTAESAVIGFGALVGMQFLFGMGEAGAFPNIAKAVYNWFPATERGFAQGAVWLSARFMGGLTPLAWVLITDGDFGGLTWRQALWLFAGLALVWCLAFALVFRNTPAEHPGVGDAERQAIAAGRAAQPGHAGVPWAAIFGSRNVLALCGMYAVCNFCWYFLLYYLPGALKGQFADRGDSPGGRLLLALVGGAPLLVGMAGCLIGGLLTDRHVRRTGDRKWGRRTYGMLGYGLAGLCYAAAAGTQVADLGDGVRFWAFAGSLVMVGFANDLMMAPSWATAQDIGGRYSAIVSGAMNMVGNLGATLGNLVTGLILEQATGPAKFVPLFVLFAGVYFVGVGLWLLIDPTKPVAADPADGDRPA